MVKNADTKTRLHSRNKHRERYNFDSLIKAHENLNEFVELNKFGDESINFFNPEAVKALNTALLKEYYDIAFWEIPENYLCPPIPGRADYIHHVSDLLFELKKTTESEPSPVNCLDIGVGANCIYPIIGLREYNWNFVASEVDQLAIKAAKRILDANQLNDFIELRAQENSKHVLNGIIKPEEKFELVICNPPFHSSAREAATGSTRKLKNLKGKQSGKPILNFGGQSNELWCEGGEVAFIKNLITESKQFKNSCLWFTSLVAKQKHLKTLSEALAQAGVAESKTIAMGQGNKSSRIIAWTFFDFKDRKNWKKVSNSAEVEEEGSLRQKSKNTIKSRKTSH